MKELLIKIILLKRSNTKKNFFRDLFKSKLLKNGTLVTLVYILIFLLEINLTLVLHGGNPTRNIFGWQKPCYLLGEGYVDSFKKLMEETDWEKYGTGNYDKCSDCMAHCGYEASAVTDVFKNPLKAITVALNGPKTDGKMAKEIDLSKSRDPDFVFDSHVQKMMKEIHDQKNKEGQKTK